MEDIIKREEKQNSWKADEKDSLALYQMEGAKTCFDWILPALMRDWKKAEKWIQVRLVTREELSYGAATAGRAEVLAREVLEHWDTESRICGMERASVRTDELYLSIFTGRADEIEIYSLRTEKENLRRRTDA